MFELSSREIAIAFWLVAFAFYVGQKADVRTSFWRFVRAFFAPALTRVWAIIALYVSGLVWLLSSMGLWTPANLKTTILWFAVFAIGTLVEVNRITPDRTYYKRTILELLGLTAIFEFLSSLATFSLPVELVLVPTVTLVVTMLAFARVKKDPKYAPTIKVLEWVLACLGFFLVGYTLWWMWGHFSEVTTFDNVREFSVPVLLSLGYLPVILITSFITSYQQNLSRLKRSLRNDELYRYARWRAVLTFGMNVENFKRWVRHVGLFGCRSRDDVDTSIARIKHTLQRETIVTEVPEAKGWNPQLARDFLTKAGITTGDYHKSPFDWSASSPYKKLGEGLLPNNIAYYITGDADAAKELRLKLNINEPEDVEAADREFAAFSECLYREAMKAESNAAFRSLIESDNSHVNDGATKISISRENWLGGIRGGFERTLTFQRGESGST